MKKEQCTEIVLDENTSSTSQITKTQPYLASILFRHSIYNVEELLYEQLFVSRNFLIVFLASKGERRSAHFSWFIQQVSLSF